MKFLLLLPISILAANNYDRESRYARNQDQIKQAQFVQKFFDEDSDSVSDNNFFYGDQFDSVFTFNDELSDLQQIPKLPSTDSFGNDHDFWELKIFTTYVRNEEDCPKIELKYFGYGSSSDSSKEKNAVESFAEKKDKTNNNNKWNGGTFSFFDQSFDHLLPQFKKRKITPTSCQSGTTTTVTFRTPTWGLDCDQYPGSYRSKKESNLFNNQVTRWYNLNIDKLVDIRLKRKLGSWKGRVELINKANNCYRRMRVGKQYWDRKERVIVQRLGVTRKCPVKEPGHCWSSEYCPEILSNGASVDCDSVGFSYFV